MQSLSQFQSQFPLSQSKFYKKITAKLPRLISSSVLFTLALLSISSIISVATLNFKGSSLQATSFPSIGQYILGTLLVLAVLLVVNGLYISAYIKRYYYDSTDFITIKKGVFTPTEIHVQYQKIQDVYVDQDLLDRLFGLFDVHIASATYASGIEAHIDGVDAVTAESLKNYILAKIQGSTSVAAASSASVAVDASKSAAANFSEEISSQTFPIDNKWYGLTIVGSIITSVVISVVIFSFLFKQSVFGNFIPTVIVSVIIFVIIFISTIIWKNNFYFAFLPQFVMQKTKVISSREKHLPYKSIQDVMIRQGFFEKIFGLSTVTIQNAASSGEDVVIPGQPLEKGQKLVEELNKVLASRNESMGL